MAKSGRKNGKQPGTFTGRDDPRNGRGPAKGAPNAGRPPDWFRAQMGELATRDETVAFLRDCLDDPENRDTALKALGLVLDRWIGKPTQRQEVTGADGGPLETLSHADSPLERISSQLARIAARRQAGRDPERLQRNGT